MTPDRIRHGSTAHFPLYSTYGHGIEHCVVQKLDWKMVSSSSLEMLSPSILNLKNIFQK